MSDPDKCDREVFEKGESIAMGDACMWLAETFVTAVAAESGQRVDWHYSAGRVNIICLGDLDKARAAIVKLAPMLKEDHPVLPEHHRCRCGTGASGAPRKAKHHGKGQVVLYQ